MMTVEERRKLIVEFLWIEAMSEEAPRGMADALGEELFALFDSINTMGTEGVTRLGEIAMQLETISNHLDTIERGISGRTKA